MPRKRADHRTTTFQVRMTPHEREKLEQLAHQDGIDASAWVRLTVNHLHRERFPEQYIVYGAKRGAKRGKRRH